MRDDACLIVVMRYRRQYLNFTTPVGVNLAAAAQSGSASFLIHETGFQPRLRDWNHPGVDSPFWRFYHNPEAGCRVRCGEEVLPLEPSRCVLIPSNTIFDCLGTSEPVAHFWIHFSVGSPGRLLLDTRPMSLPMDATLRALMKDALAAHHQFEEPLRVQRLHHLSAALLHTAFSRLSVPLLQTLPEALEALLNWIEQAPQARLSNDVLADRVGMRVEAFIRWFRDHMKQTPAVYVSAARVRLARQALALTAKSIDQIAADTGFPNRHYLTRVFSRQVGCGPAEFRARQQRRRGR